MNRSQANNNKKGDLSKVFSQKRLTNWPRSPRTRDDASDSAAHLLRDLGPVTGPLCVLGLGGTGAAQGLCQLSQSVICSISAAHKAFRMSVAMFSCSFGLAFV